MSINKLTPPLNNRILLSCLIFSASCIVTPASCLASDFAGSLVGVTVSDSEGTNIPPVASFTYSQDTKTISVDASQSTDQDGSIIEYKWDFGDGDTATGTSVTHTYPDTGNYPITLTLIDNNNSVSILQKSITMTVPCSDLPSISQTNYSSKAKIGNFSDVYYQGTTYNGPSIDVCKVDIGMSLGAGDISSKLFFVEIHNVDTENNLTTLIGRSNQASGNAVPIDCGFVSFSFDSPVNLNAGSVVTVHMAENPDSKNYATACVKSYADSYVDGAAGTWQQASSLRTIRTDGSDLMFQFFSTK